MPVFPLSVHSSGRYWIDKTGAPFYMAGEAAWSLIAELNLSDVRQYLDNRVRKGYSAIIVNLIEFEFTDHTPKWRNANGDVPFNDITRMDLSNSAYFDYAVTVCNEAALRGIEVLLAPAYLGFNGASPVEGWYDTMVTNGTTQLTSYGNMVGTKFAPCSNVIILNGGDRNPSDRSLVDAVANGILATFPGVLMTAHPNQNTDPRSVYAGSAWTMSAGGVYTYDLPIYSDYDTEYADSPAKPSVLLESRYENELDWTPQRLRQQAWWSVTSGFCGHFFGNDLVWQLASGWQSAMDNPGCLHMNYLRNLIVGHPWHKLVPNADTTIVTANRGTNGGTDWTGVARASDGSWIVCYVPTNRASITVDMTKMAGRCKAWWYDPTNATLVAAAPGILQNTGARAFSMPGNNSGGDPDWVFYMDQVFSEGRIVAW